MGRLFIFATFFIGLSSLYAQKAPTYTEKSDAQSISILKKVHQKYSSYSSMQMDLKLTVTSGKNIETQTSTLLVKGEKFRMNGKTQDIASDGKTLYNHQKTAKEMYISNAGEEEMSVLGSPEKMLKMYEKDFISALIATTTENGKTVYKIEFKPKSKDTDFSKVRVTVDKATSQVVAMKIFDKSNTHYNIAISNFKPNAAVNNALFIIAQKDLPKGTEILDIR